ncbi:MAG: hypothetical protein ACKPEY_18720, partial [Planctomycetota bacterium]
TARVQQAFQWAFGRSATTEEVSASLSFVRRTQEGQAGQGRVPADEALFKAWSQFCQSLMGAAEFRVVQ